LNKSGGRAGEPPFFAEACACVVGSLRRRRPLIVHHQIGRAAAQNGCKVVGNKTTQKRARKQNLVGQIQHSAPLPPSHPGTWVGLGGGKGEMERGTTDD